MFTVFKKISVLAILFVVVSPALADVYMDEAWAQKVCDAWNKNIILTKELAGISAEKEGYNWIANNNDRGYKLIQMYRTKCGVDSKIQLIIQDKNNKAMCIQAGKPDGKVMIAKYDYLMHATDAHWECMGKASFGCGAMGAMMSGKLKFTGPKGEAMRVMGAFGAFLKVAGAVAGDKESCPAK